jgi:rhodanese-related sulfurtransferase
MAPVPRAVPCRSRQAAEPSDRLYARRMDGYAAEVSATEALELVRGDAILLDVREDHEWVAGHAPEATHMPMSRITEHAAELPVDKTIVCVCHVGTRSAAVAAALNRAGWRALNLAGGMEAWAAAGLPVIDTEGRAGQVT